MDAQKIEVNGRTYQVLPLTGMNALNLDRKVLGLWTRFNSGRNDAEFLTEFCRAFYELPQDEYEALLLLSFRGVSYIGKDGEANESLGTLQAVGDHFNDHKPDLYSVLLKVWETNRLSPFV